MTDSKNIKIIQTVASGGTAVLYKAVQTSLDRIVAVKRLHQHLTDDENFTRRFILEAKAAAALDHSNIVRVIDFGEHEGSYQMVMEYVEGESLKEVMDRWRPIKYDMSLVIVHQILLGLEHAHAKGIVHRDIKPGNVMVTEQGLIKITDFGLAKLTQSNSQHTAANSILGTPLYMSPEQAFGESVDQRSDLFSLGTVLYELITGKQPFNSDNYMGVIQNIINRDIPRPRTLVPELPAEVEAIIGKALAKDRDNRFPNARQFRQAIEDYLGTVQIGEIASRLRILLEKNTVTQILPAGSVVVERKRSGAGRIVAAVLVIAALGGATGVVLLKPELIEGFTADAPPSSETQRASSSNGNGLDFDMSTLVRPTAPGSTGTSSVDANPTTPLTGAETASGGNAANTMDKTAAQPTAGATTEPAPTKPATSEAKKEPAPRKTPVAKTGFLDLMANPSAEIWVDGAYLGDTPNKLKLASGSHSLELRHPRYETYAEDLRIVTGELSRRNVTLKKLKGMVSLATQEGAELFVDGVLYGVTPILKPIEMDAGQHTLSLKKSGFFTWTSEITVEPKQTLPLKIMLSQKY